jgi:hypothetical protein
MNRRQMVKGSVMAAAGVMLGACCGEGEAGVVAGPLVGPFVDTAGHEYEWAIERIRLAGLTAGCGTEPPTYCPDRALTRGEAAVFLARVLDMVG